VKEKEAELKIKKLEGTNYGYPFSGLLDGLFTYLNSYLEKINNNKEDITLFFLLLKESGLDAKIVELLENLNPHFIVSPKGVLSFLLFICDAAHSKKFGAAIFAENIFQVGSV
jgi:hypothetical protein